MPVIGYLSSSSPRPLKTLLAAFHQGLSETGYVEGYNAAIEYRWAEGRYDRLSALATDLVDRKVNVIAAMSGSPTILAAKSATSTIPIIFLGGGDLVGTGLIASLARPAATSRGSASW
jgi:putative ABC transport system substrate-binding protein